MKFLSVPLSLIWLALGHASAFSAEPAGQAIPLDSFTFTGSGQYSPAPDRRELFQINHPWQVSEKGAFGRMTAQVTLPSEAQPPYYLHFYSSDNNSDANKDFQVKPHDSTAFVDYKPGHRFKELAIDGRVVWSCDVFDRKKGDGNLSVDLTPWIKPGVPFTLSVALRDEVASSERLPGDRAEFSDTRQNFNMPDKYLRFETKSYWGDFLINQNPQPAPSTLSSDTTISAPSAVYLARGNASFFDLQNGIALEPELLDLVKAGGRWPVVMGLPFAEGVLPDSAKLRLFAADGTLLPAQFQTMNRWPDGSVRWASVALVMEDAISWPVRLKASDGTKPAFLDPVTTSDQGKTLEIKNSLLTLSFQQASPSQLKVLPAQGPPLDLLGEKSSLSFRQSERDFRFQASSARLLSHDPSHAEFEITGEFTSGTDHAVHGLIRAALFAGCPYVRILATITNTTPSDTAASSYDWKIDGLSSSLHAEDWIAAPWGQGGVTIALKDFSHLGPNGFAQEKDSLDLQLYRATDHAPLAMHSGEAKTHELWLAFGSQPPAEDSARLFSQMVNTPPRLASAQLIRESMAWGEMAHLSPDTHPEEAALIETKLLPFFLDTEAGFRSYGSLSSKDSNYANFYWNTVHTLYALYAMTGERSWFDLAERSSRQYMDAVLCHWSANPTEIGGAHGYEGPLEGPNRQDFSNRPFMIRLQYPHPCFDHWNMTVDPMGYDLGLSIATFTLRNQDMYKAARLQSARHQGWNLMDMVRAWQETGQDRFLANASNLIEVVKSYMDLRRGTYLSFHGNMSQPGAQPFMDGILGVGLRRYFQVSERPDVLTLMSRITDSIYSEAGLTKENKGQKVVEYLYSPDPFQRAPDGFKTINRLNPTYVGNQAYLASLLGDARFAEVSLATWRAFLCGDQVNAAQSCFDLPAAIYWTDQAKALLHHENTSDSQHK